MKFFTVLTDRLKLTEVQVLEALEMKMNGISQWSFKS